MRAIRRRHPLRDRKWYQVLAIGLAGFGTLGVLVCLVPQPDLVGSAVGLSVGALGVTFTLWNWRTYSWWARAGLAVVTCLGIFSMGVRFTLALTDIDWRWILPALAAILFSLITPIAWPSAAHVVWREQTAPVTRLGRILLVASVSLASVAGVLGASAGIFARRMGAIEPVLSVTAALAFLVSSGMAFTFSYQLWPERPWLRIKEETE